MARAMVSAKIAEGSTCVSASASAPASNGGLVRADRGISSDEADGNRERERRFLVVGRPTLEGETEALSMRSKLSDGAGDSEFGRVWVPEVAELASSTSCAVQSPASESFSDLRSAARRSMGAERDSSDEEASTTKGSLFLPFPLPLRFVVVVVVLDPLANVGFISNAFEPVLEFVVEAEVGSTSFRLDLTTTPSVPVRPISCSEALGSDSRPAAARSAVETPLLIFLEEPSSAA